jgi:hypothetical protein
MNLKFGFDMVKIWNYDLILELFKEKYPKYLDYYTNLILNKSRENFAKYFIIKEYGGLFVNFYILYNGTPLEIITMHKTLLGTNHMVFWSEKDLSNKDILLDTFDYFEEIINDDIFYIKNNNNSFINYLIKNIDLKKIPINEFQNKKYLGNIFFSNILYIFYNDFFGTYPSPIIIDNRWFSKFFSKKINFKDNDILLSVKIKKDLLCSQSYKNILYPNLLEFKNPDNVLIPWDKFYKTTKAIQNVTILLLVNFTSILTLFIVILIMTCCEYIAKIYIQSFLDIKLNKPVCDSKIFYKVSKFKIFRELCKNWKIIKQEAIIALENAPKLNIARNYADWVDNEDYFKTIVQKYGWINGWKADNEVNEVDNINTEWFNYGLLYKNSEFIENIKNCPKTFSFLHKIKKYINISGFSMMIGNCVLEPHTDMTGKSFNSLAFHLGLIVPTPNETCKLVVQDNNGVSYGYVEKEGGSMIFDATHKHFAYNQSNKVRIILYIDFKI